ncbi:PAS domain-containing sensor histidine kinase [Sphingomonas ginkgonis]|uniref:histidine kinase n=1 Tax=Sphingomonas ginkgonis TaxID=2315330 RepID=A0A429VA11_9SPHN|nr:PAS domain-containing sensor histidine kinase [Sphingomonas ginkgonis]RST30830.1 PAS domain-containing sensor histidine kinase [Sphingomonas ginkgonis]
MNAIAGGFTRPAHEPGSGEGVWLTSGDMLRHQFDSSPDCLFFVRSDAGGQLVYADVNNTALKQLGQPLHAVLGRAPKSLMPGAAGEAIQTDLERVFTSGEPFSSSPMLDLPDASGLSYDATYTPVRNDAGQIVGVFGRARDVTALRQAEQASRQSFKMDALGSLAGGVAHDFNNLLSELIACLTLIDRHTGEEETRELVQDGLRALERGSSLTGRLLAFARPQPLEKRCVDLRGQLEDLGRMLRRTLGRRIIVRIDVDADLRKVMVDVNELELAIINLAVNARDAMPDGGTLTVRARNVETEEEPCLAPGSFVRLSVVDTGTGMDAATLAHAVEPFFTTKAEGKGTGLGLSIVSSMAAQLGGAMRLTSRPGEGSQVDLLLPAC